MKTKTLSIAAIFFTLGIFVSFTVTSVTARMNKFPDIEPGQYFSNAIETFVNRGVLTGYSNGKFGPHDPVSRGQTAVILNRYDRQTIQPIFQHIEALRAELNLGACGDNVIQTGESCDDGNNVNGDGCSQNCLSELTVQACDNGRPIGQIYASSDGCNTCECTIDGVICTTEACQEDGVVVPPGCGNGICEAGEEEILFCSPGCRVRPGGKTEGNCQCVLKCPEDCRTEESCDEKRADLVDFIDDQDGLGQEGAACSSDSDCEVFTQRCPYATCGKAVNKGLLPELRAMAQSMISTCKTHGQVACGSCNKTFDAACRSGKCVLIEE